MSLSSLFHIKTALNSWIFSNHNTMANGVIHLFMKGVPSQLDIFDPKPLLKKWEGKPIPISFRTERKTGTAFPSPFSFKKYGKSGLEVSELFPYTAESADHLCVIRS